MGFPTDSRAAVRGILRLILANIRVVKSKYCCPDKDNTGTRYVLLFILKLYIFKAGVLPGIA
jgi:hypothetical protein